MKDHPSDEFDAVPERSTRQGVHRRRLIPVGPGGLALKMTVGVLALLLLVGAFLLLPRLGLTVNGGGDPGASPPSRSLGVQHPLRVRGILKTPGN